MNPYDYKNILRIETFRENTRSIYLLFPLLFSKRRPIHRVRLDVRSITLSVETQERYSRPPKRGRDPGTPHVVIRDYDLYNSLIFMYRR